jgi:hypothetical protein
LPLRFYDNPVRHPRSTFDHIGQSSGNSRRESIALVSSKGHGRDRYRGGLVACYTVERNA